MTEDAESANEIADYLYSKQVPLLKGRVLNIHTRLKGRIKTVKRGGREIKEFVESETGMKPDDLRALREMSRALDSKDSPYRCVVSVMMLREGWDVRNVTTIVPLRPYSAKAGILPEQTLGRGLRRMIPLGDVPETVTVVHHPAFRKLYEEELAQEGLDIAVLPIHKALKETVTIFVDRSRPRRRRIATRSCCCAYRTRTQRAWTASPYAPGYRARAHSARPAHKAAAQSARQWRPLSGRPHCQA